jgi:hypothetical protein
VHGWERAYCSAFRKQYPQAKLIGYQNAIASPLWLSYFVSSKEWGKIPFPDRVVANGAYHYGLLNQNGIPVDVLSWGGAIRYRTLGEEQWAADDEKVRSSRLRILVALSVLMTQAAELLLVTLEAFADPNLFDVTLKSSSILFFRPLVLCMKLASVHFLRM